MLGITFRLITAADVYQYDEATGLYVDISENEALMNALLNKGLQLRVSGIVKPNRENRDLLYSALTEYGFDCVHPDGAFYLFVKSPEPDAAAFAEKARKYELLLVPSDSFGCPGYVRIAYCVSHEMIRRSLPAFRLLAKEYGLDIR